MKEPLVILEEIDEIERLEAEVSTPQPTDKSLQEKKRKLHASLDRIVKYYVREPALLLSKYPLRTEIFLHFIFYW